MQDHESKHRVKHLMADPKGPEYVTTCILLREDKHNNDYQC